MKKFKFISILLAVAAFLSIYAAMATVMISSDPGNRSSYEFFYELSNKGWLAILWLPIPVLCLIYGFKNPLGRKLKKNIIMGILFTFIVTSFALSTTSMKGQFIDSHDFSEYVSGEIGFQLPTESRVVYTINKTQDTLTQMEVKRIGNLRILNQTDLTFFEQVKKSELWVDYQTSSMRHIIPSNNVISTSTDSYFLLYSVDTLEYNNLYDITKGNKFIYVSYAVSSNILTLMELERVK